MEGLRKGVRSDLQSELNLKLKRAISLGSLAVSRDATKPTLSAVLLHLTKTAIRIVSTDGFRLAEIDFRQPMEPSQAVALAERIPTGLVHINDQTIHDEPPVPFGGVKQSGAGTRLGGFEANLEAFTDLQWVTIRSEVPDYPF